MYQITAESVRNSARNVKEWRCCFAAQFCSSHRWRWSQSRYHSILLETELIHLFRLNYQMSGYKMKGILLLPKQIHHPIIPSIAIIGLSHCFWIFLQLPWPITIWDRIQHISITPSKSNTKWPLIFFDFRFSNNDTCGFIRVVLQSVMTLLWRWTYSALLRDQTPLCKDQSIFRYYTPHISRKDRLH